jgi:hypothetical protein
MKKSLTEKSVTKNRGHFGKKSGTLRASVFNSFNLRREQTCPPFFLLDAV